MTTLERTLERLEPSFHGGARSHKLRRSPTRSPAAPTRTTEMRDRLALETPWLKTRRATSVVRSPGQSIPAEEIIERRAGSTGAQTTAHVHCVLVRDLLAVPRRCAYMSTRHASREEVHMEIHPTNRQMLMLCTTAAAGNRALLG